MSETELVIWLIWTIPDEAWVTVAVTHVIVSGRYRELLTTYVKMLSYPWTNLGDRS